MFFDYTTLTSKEFYSLIVSLLVKEAENNREDIQLDHFVREDFAFDAFFPNGSALFGYSKGWPVVVVIKKHLTEYSFHTALNALRDSDLGARLAFITIENDSGVSVNRYQTYNYGSFDIYGRDFIERLINNNPDALLNTVLGNPNNIIYKDDDVFDDYNGRTVYYISDKEKKFKHEIRNDDPQRISKLNEDTFRKYLSNDERKSNCAIFIGNGVSIPFGSDSWNEMINNILDYLKPYHIENPENVKKAFSNSSYALASFVKETLKRDGLIDKYHDAIHYSLYRKYSDVMHTVPSLIKTIVRGKIKYPNLPLLTYNFDTFVERAYHFETKKDLFYYAGNSRTTIETLPFYSSVIHLHGYLSYSKKHHKGLVLSDSEYYNAYLDKKTSWAYWAQIETLQRYKCLFVGSSMSDLFQMSMIDRAMKESKDERWNCFALMCFKDLKPMEIMRIMQYYKEKGINIIYVDDFDKLPDKLTTLLSL